MSDRTVPCPACKGPSLYAPANPWRPFCSQRCREHDLGAWASESYRMEERSRGDEATEEPSPATRGVPAELRRHSR
jgi:endogenous inhibitor of DNA gyrase (YacG/DUF329 family)